jgi:hypothetical protein
MCDLVWVEMDAGKAGPLKELLVKQVGHLVTWLVLPAVGGCCIKTVSLCSCKCQFFLCMRHAGYRIA